jgi:hypothetical protein
MYEKKLMEEEMKSSGSGGKNEVSGEIDRILEL